MIWRALATYSTAYEAYLVTSTVTGQKRLRCSVSVVRVPSAIVEAVLPDRRFR